MSEKRKEEILREENLREKTTACPCQSGKAYADCCQPFHQFRQTPPTAEALMRSRYSAYTQVNIDYIVATTVPSQQPLLDIAAMTEWGKSTRWAGLQILAHNPALSRQHSSVEFQAAFHTEQGLKQHHERSLFVQIDQRYFFVDPTVPLPTQKQPCLCGSPKKFKACCGKFL